MSDKQVRAQYTREFKQEAVRQVRSGQAIAVVAKVLGIPKAGFWGFAALGSGPKKEYKGKELSQDAVIWIRADKLD